MKLIGEKKWFALFGTISVLTLLLFQNCAPTALQTDLSEAEDPAESYPFFRYSYEKKPHVYANLALVFSSETAVHFSRFKFFGLVAPADEGSERIHYSVKITDDEDRSLCVGDTGILEPGEEKIMFECLGSSTLTKATVTLTTTYQGHEEIFKASFSK